MLLELDTVYETKLGANEYEGAPTFTVEDGTVNMYVSNSQVAPVDASTMVLDTSSPLDVGVYPVGGAVRYILFETVTGVPIVTERFLIA